MPSLRFLFLSVALMSASTRVIAQTPPEVGLTTARRGEINRFVSLPGTLRANQQVTLHAKVAGYLKSIAVDKGDAVKAGQLLAELELPEILAEHARHDAELRIAKLESERIKGARSKAPDLITPQFADTADARLAMAQASMTQNETMQRYARISAPFDGIVTMRYVDSGAFVPAATASANPQAAAILTVMDYSTIRVHVAVPEVEAARVRVGQPIVVTTDSLPGKTFRAKVSRHTGALDEGTRSLLVEADLPNPDLALRPGMYAMVKIGVEMHSNAVLVPAAALVREKAAGFLFLLEDGKAKRVPVKYGFNDGTNVEILEGLPENAPVIVPGKVALTNGQAVKAVESK